MSKILLGSKLHLMIAFLALNACSKSKLIFSLPTDDPAGVSTATSSSPSSDQEGLAAFQTGFYAFVNQQGCVQCHGSIVHPTFAAPDINVAYAAFTGNEIGSTTPLVNSSSPLSSIFILYAGNSHCGAAPCSNPGVRSQVQQLLTAWANVEIAEGNNTSNPSTPSGPAYYTAGLAIQPNLPNLTDPNPAVMRFSLSQLNPPIPSLDGVLLEVEIQMVNASEYRISNPRIGGNSVSINLQGIHVFISPAGASGVGTEDTAQGNLWDSLNAVAQPFALPLPLSATPLTATPLAADSLEVQMQSNSDIMTIGFDSLTQ